MSKPNKHIEATLAQLAAIDAEDDAGRTLLGRLEEALQPLANHDVQMALHVAIPRDEKGQTQQRSPEYAAFRAMQLCADALEAADQARGIIENALIAARSALVYYQLTWEDDEDQ